MTTCGDGDRDILLICVLDGCNWMRQFWTTDRTDRARSSSSSFEPRSLTATGPGTRPIDLVGVMEPDVDNVVQLFTLVSLRREEWRPASRGFKVFCCVSASIVGR